MKAAQSFLQEDNGNFSATRLAFLLWIIGVLVVWIMDSVKAASLQGIPESVAAIIGILMTGKVAQKFGEKPSGKPDDNPAAST
ncbi:MAG: hypothetical protein WBW55_12270 [Desulfobaccales bacterium]